MAKSLIKEKTGKIVIIAYLVLSLICLALVAFFDIGSANIVDGQLNIQINLLLNGLVTFIPIIFIAHGVFALERYLRRNRSNEPQISKQAMYLSRGMILTLCLIFISNYILTSQAWNNFTDVVNSIAVLLFVIIIAFSVFSLRLFNFSSFLYKAIAYIAALVVVFAIYTTVAILVAQFILGIQLDTKTEIILAIFSAITALVFQPLKRFFDKITNAIFYRDAYDAQVFLNQINNKIVNTVDLYELLNSTAKIVTDNTNVEFCDFYIDEKSSIDFHVAGTNPKIFGQNGWEKLDELIDKSTQKIFTINEETDEEIAELMRKLKVETIAKMMSQDQHVGYLIVGQKRSGNKSTKQDIQMVEIVADEVAIAVQNSLRFIEIAQFNITLQKKIEIATTELQKSNAKLVELDEAKDEFISMASHQLRTPLTSVKGYISMLQEGDAGEVNAQQKSFLDQAFLSSQRMVYLIADLLNVSRLKTGKFVIDAKPTYLPDVIASEIKQLTETVKARGLEMKFNKPTEFPMLKLDETKIRQVIMNFADNSVYYTPNGGLITIKLEATDKTIEFTVTDTGIGVPKSEQHKLFTKFYRAGNARKARPDGTGLGLFMAKKVVIAQGGAIIFKTTEGKGSTFGFSFPREKLEIKK
ncbi:MAG: GAF domain-containing sensor histidine kinase [Candidatus Saccharibacteria bacterium]